MVRKRRSGCRQAIVLLACALGGCVGAPRPSALMQSVSGSDVQVAELRTRVRALAPRFSGELEALADEVAASSNDPKVRLSMTTFKINALPQMQMALFQPDPLAALIDAWALLIQLQHAVRAEGPTREKILQRFMLMEEELQLLWSEVTGKADTRIVRERVQRWAAQHPIDRSLAARKSTADLFAQVTQQTGTGPLATATRALETTQDLAARLDVLAAFGPKEVRWQAEYLLRDMLNDPTLLRSDEGDLASLLGSMQELTSTVNTLPVLVPQERDIILRTLREERVQAQAFLRSEREAFTLDLQRMGSTWIDQSFDRAEGLIGRLFLFTVLLVVLLFLGGAAVVLMALRTWERRRVPPQRAQRRPGPPVEV